MNTENALEQSTDPRVEEVVTPRRHPVTMENSPEETIKRMRALPERAAQLREAIRARREAHTR